MSTRQERSAAAVDFREVGDQARGDIPLVAREAGRGRHQCVIGKV